MRGARDSGLALAPESEHDAAEDSELGSEFAREAGVSGTQLAFFCGLSMKARKSCERRRMSAPW